jgi:hypothetical protein
MDYGTAMRIQLKMDIMEDRNDRLERAHSATGDVTECCPYKCKYAQV